MNNTEEQRHFNIPQASSLSTLPSPKVGSPVVSLSLRLARKIWNKSEMDRDGLYLGRENAKLLLLGEGD